LDWFEGFMHVKRASLLKVEIRLLRFGDYGTSFLSSEEVSGCLDFAFVCGTALFRKLISHTKISQAI